MQNFYIMLRYLGSLCRHVAKTPEEKTTLVPNASSLVPIGFHLFLSVPINNLHVVDVGAFTSNFSVVSFIGHVIISIVSFIDPVIRTIVSFKGQVIIL